MNYAKSRTNYEQPPGIDFDPDSSMTEQSHAEECDINRIMAKYIQTGVCNHISKYEGSYGDFKSLEFADALEIVTAGDQMFSELPAAARAHFQNDPYVFMRFMEANPDTKVLAQLGLTLRREDEPSASPKLCVPDNGQTSAPQENGGISDADSSETPD